MSAALDTPAPADPSGPGPPRQETSVSVIIPLGRDADQAETCLRSVLSQGFATAFEVILAAEGDNPIADRLERDFPPVRVVRCPSGAGPGGARNAGIDQAEGKYLAFIDADCIARRDWLARIASACRANGGGPVCGWVESSGRWIGLACDLAERGVGRPNRPIEIREIWGANMCVSTRALGAARFAEGLDGAEEICLLASMRPGTRVMLDPSVAVLRLRRLTFSQALRRIHELGRRAAIVRRHLAMPGLSFARHRWLLPLLPISRLGVTAWRVSRCGVRQMLAFAVLWPLVLCHLLWYTAGFAEGAFGQQARRHADLGHQVRGGTVL